MTRAAGDRKAHCKLLELPSCNHSVIMPNLSFLNSELTFASSFVASQAKSASCPAACQSVCFIHCHINCNPQYYSSNFLRLLRRMAWPAVALNYHGAASDCSRVPGLRPVRVAFSAPTSFTHTPRFLSDDRLLVWQGPLYVNNAPW